MNFNISFAFTAAAAVQCGGHSLKSPRTSYIVQIMFSCIPDEKIQLNPRFWSGSEIQF